MRCVILTSSCLFVNLHRCSRPLVNLSRCSRPVVSVASGPLTQVPSVTLNAKLERPPVMRQLALFKHSCIFPLAKWFVSMSAGFRLRALSRWSADGVPLPLAPTRLGYGDVSLASLCVLSRSLSTLCYPPAHVALPPLPCQQPWPQHPELSMHSWSTCKTPLHLSLSPPHFELLPTKQEDARQASRTKTKSTVGSSNILPSRCLRRCPRLAVQLVDHRRPNISDFPSKIAPDVLRACMFLMFGRCIRLASSFTAKCSSHLYLLR